MTLGERLSLIAIAVCAIYVLRLVVETVLLAAGR